MKMKVERDNSVRLTLDSRGTEQLAWVGFGLV